MSQAHYLLKRRDPPPSLSLVLPVYNEEEVLPLLLARLREFVPTLPSAVEIIFVNDGSTDRTLELLLAAAAADRRIRVLSLARNFGHQMAATAGLDKASGDAVVLMDADLQDPPELIHDMIRAYCDGYDVVYAQRVARSGDGWFKRGTAWVFYRIMRWCIHRDLPVDTGDFRLISRNCLAALRPMRELHRFLRGMITWVGFPQTAVRFERPARAAGVSKYPLRRMLLLSWNAAVSFSPLPLRLSFAVGGAIAGVGAAYGVYAFVRAALGLYVVPGWTSSIVVTCLIGGAIMISVGILGEYVGRIFEEIKQRPLYIVNVSANTGLDTDVDLHICDADASASLPPR